jgi:hypothetical protein
MQKQNKIYNCQLILNQKWRQHKRILVLWKDRWKLITITKTQRLTEGLTVMMIKIAAGANYSRSSSQVSSLNYRVF